MTSKIDEAYVWIWLPGENEPIVAGKLTANDGQILFNYGRSYLDNKKSIPIYSKELPLRAGFIEPLKGLSMAGSIRDGAPDAWGRKVILNRRFGRKGVNVDLDQLDELTYLMESGSDRTGALDFQASATEYIARNRQSASLDELQKAAEKVDAGVPLSPALAAALVHGSSIGGARPKSLIETNDKKFIAKFSLQADLYNVVKAEYIAMVLAKRAGLNVASVGLEKSLKKDVLLVERFDRTRVAKGWLRKSMVSALTLQELDEMLARYASYEDFAEIVRRTFKDPAQTLRELFSRMVFNVLCGNTDDHARNHAAFWDGKELVLTPAYDLCPQSRVGREATQAMLIKGQDRRSRLATCLESASNFQLTESEAMKIIAAQVDSIKANWNEVCDLAELSEVDKNLFWKRQFLNPYAFEDLEGKFM